MMGLLFSRAGLTAILVATLSFAFFVQTKRLAIRSDQLTASVVQTTLCKRDNDRLIGEVNDGLKRIEEQNEAIQTFKVEADKLNTTADQSAKLVLDARRKARDTNRPTDHASLNARLEELFR